MIQHIKSVIVHSFN